MQIAAPQDKLLIELNMKLNSTYVPYGPAGRVGAANQIEQDVRARSMGRQTEAGRVAAKATRLYDSAHWDLVDGVAQREISVEEVKTEDLPPPMQTMSVDERKDYVMQQSAARAEVQKEIAKVSAEREEFLKKTKAEQLRDGKTSLDDAMQQSMRRQAEAKGFVFE
jgi:hypothetical protein